MLIYSSTNSFFFFMSFIYFCFFCGFLLFFFFSISRSFSADATPHISFRSHTLPSLSKTFSTHSITNRILSYKFVFCSLKLKLNCEEHNRTNYTSEKLIYHCNTIRSFSYRPRFYRIYSER